MVPSSSDDWSKAVGNTGYRAPGSAGRGGKSKDKTRPTRYTARDATPAKRRRRQAVARGGRPVSRAAGRSRGRARAASSARARTGASKRVAAFGEGGTCHHRPGGSDVEERTAGGREAEQPGDAAVKTELR